MKKTGIIVGVLAVLLLITGVVVYKVGFSAKSRSIASEEEEQSELLPQVDESVIVEVTKSKSKDNTVTLRVKGLARKMASVAYELTYESEGLIKGVNSGSKPIDVADQDAFEREIYLGTCSKNVCKPDVGVSKVSVVLEFTAADGRKSQFSKEYEL